MPERLKVKIVKHAANFIKRTQMRRIFSSLFLVFIALFTSCKEDVPTEATNNAPEIQSISSSPSSVKINETIILSCVATDADGDELSYSWSAEKGNFTNGTLGSSVTWKSPSEEGTFVVQVIVSDGKEIDKDVKSIISDKNFGMLTGIVWDKVIGEGISGVKITILNRVAYTDTNGHYQMSNFPQGTYDIIAEKEHYTSFKGEVIFNNVDRDFDMAMEYLLSDLSGVVKNNLTGELLENIAININGKKDTTDEDGYYEILGLEKGSYTINADGGVAWYHYFEEPVVLNNRLVMFNISLESKSCPESPTVTYAGKTYNTVKIGNQCWLKENLNVGTMINGNLDASDNGIIEKYCYDNDESNCNKYGGLYQWNEAMQYNKVESTQGICPMGWRIPTYDEFISLQEEVGRSSSILKSIGQGSGDGAGTNTSGFSALLVGSRSGVSGNFYSLDNVVNFWNTGEGYSSNTAIHMYLYESTNEIKFDGHYKSYGFSIRCLKN